MTLRSKGQGREPALREPQGLELVETVESVEPVHDTNSASPRSNAHQGGHLGLINVGSGLTEVGWKPLCRDVCEKIEIEVSRSG